MDLHHYSDHELLTSVTTLSGTHRELTAALVARLGELEARKLHLLAGFSSMFDFCTKALRFSEGEAFRRILAARLCRRFPIVLSLLESGAVHLSTLELLREWLTEKNHEELLGAVAGKSKREAQTLLAARFPRPNRPSSIRRTTIDPLSEASFRVEFTASAALLEKLELCRDLMSHANPGRDLSVVIERAVDLLLGDLEKKRLGKTRRPRRTIAPLADSSRIPNQARREVYERDGLQCTYTGNGRRCEARAFLELDHEVPKALGGANDTENLRVLCRAHNQLLAEQVFGRERLERLRRLRQKQSTPSRTESPLTASPPTASPAANVATFEKVRLALRGMGFRDSEARKAVAKVALTHAANEHIELERALRDALLAATAA